MKDYDYYAKNLTPLNKVLKDIISEIRWLNISVILLSGSLTIYAVSELIKLFF